MEPTSLHRHVELDLTVEALWELIADPEQLGTWLGDEARIDVTPGGTGVVVEDGVERFVHVDHVETGRAIGFTWSERDSATTRVELEIAPLPDGRSRLVITETMPTTTATASAADTRIRWEVRVCALWACTVVAALVQ
ncbi:MAG: hypothetical protein JWM34_4979 [Ilumatobacteraceae bacterium]|nr:hypothetical protein [Ilumatobacteraceae bacterium]